MMTRRPRVLKRPRKPKTAMKRLRMMILKIKMRRRKLKTRVMPKRRKVTDSDTSGSSVKEAGMCQILFIS